MCPIAAQLTEVTPQGEVRIRDEFGSEENGMVFVATMCFLLAYVLYVVLTLIVLLNLLIAMMANTFSSTMKDSMLKWRVVCVAGLGQ